jgi:hypothetical protein
VGRTVLVLASLLAASACAGGTTPAPPAGTVTGVVVAVMPSGGLVSDDARYDTVAPARAAVVVVRGRTAAGTALVRRVRADLRGRFHVRLPAGRYALTPRAGSRLRTPVRLRPGGRAHVRLTEYPPATGKRVTL